MMQRIGKSKAAQNSKANKIKEQDEETINELKEAFKIFDSKNTGTLPLTQGKSTQGSSRPS
jgi:Ca2+-binding EF-hand superfamily protein